MESLDSLEHNLQELLARYQALQRQLRELQDINQRQREEIVRTHADLAKLQDDYTNLRTAYALVSDEAHEAEKVRARQQLANIIAKIDRAIEVLKK